ncbi:NOB1 family endonuclease [Desulfurococcus mucosus]|uniref:Nucleotide binding protein, PINc n=1 Tax=Desulfurococcus mucosus (strain ATCC 35584 / DSM 2162 / JCM 9187 / O7/1) TaxID=765177 RepID=E8RA74_DESM0|nr:nucleotide-binding protein [Desulfurococcus mucosus]ADV65380.1 nucleotide binding protein, PINc [Desulfurococcus mucosus DSM 2162]
MYTSIIVILDTGGLLAKYYRLLPHHLYRVYTTRLAAGEVVDEENKAALTDALEAGLLEVLDPDESSYSRVLEEARRIGEVSRLSETDLSIASLAVMLSGRGKVIVVTDDYSLQNLLLHLGVSFKPLRTRGIRTGREYLEYCPTCGYVPAKPGEKTCPLCGTPLTRRRASSAMR